MNRAEHLAWAKQRALQYLEWSDYSGCIASMLSDLRKHPELEKSAEIGGALAIAAGMSRDQKGALRRWVEGFN